MTTCSCRPRRYPRKPRVAISAARLATRCATAGCTCTRRRAQPGPDATNVRRGPPRADGAVVPGQGCIISTHLRFIYIETAIIIHSYSLSRSHVQILCISCTICPPAYLDMSTSLPRHVHQPTSICTAPHPARLPPSRYIYIYITP